MTRAEAGSIGSAFDAFLEEEGIADDVSRIALKKVIAAAIERRMQELQLSKTAMARRMETSRAQMNRLLDPENDGITLITIQRAAKVLGMRVRLELF
jgi:antitoxin HicB